MKIIKLFIFYWLPTVVWATIIFSFSAKPAIPTFEIHWQDFILKKTAHFFEYMIFSILIYRALKASGVSKGKAVVLAVIFCFLYASSDEIHQSFTPGREPTLRDVIIDTIGASFGGYFIWTLLHKMPKKLKTLAASLDLV